jgi:hypothetical protein
MFAPNDGGQSRVATKGRTWKGAREDELRRRSYRIFYRLIFPPPIPIVWFPPLAQNEWLGWRGLD